MLREAAVVCVVTCEDEQVVLEASAMGGCCCVCVVTCEDEQVVLEAYATGGCCCVHGYL